MCIYDGFRYACGHTVYERRSTCWGWFWAKLHYINCCYPFLTCTGGVPPECEPTTHITDMEMKCFGCQEEDIKQQKKRRVVYPLSDGLPTQPVPSRQGSYGLMSEPGMQYPTDPPVPASKRQAPQSSPAVRESQPNRGEGQNLGTKDTAEDIGASPPTVVSLEAAAVIPHEDLVLHLIAHSDLVLCPEMVTAPDPVGSQHHKRNALKLRAKIAVVSQRVGVQHPGLSNLTLKSETAAVPDKEGSRHPEISVRHYPAVVGLQVGLPTITTRLRYAETAESVDASVEKIKPAYVVNMTYYGKEFWDL
ncbi:hypothetical protein CEP53_006751 [Fusarium sp. AF-6]|nr:hypothetical protein CEP53_006751 [Fusarium sp. AF-6]